jgi:hypothetical protein
VLLGLLHFLEGPVPACSSEAVVCCLCLRPAVLCGLVAV